MRDAALMEQQPTHGAWVGLTEAASAASVSKTTLRKWVRAGKLPHRIGHGGAWAVPLDQVQTLAARVPRRAEDDTALPVLRSQMEAALASFHGLAVELGETKQAVGAAQERARALAEEVAHLRAEAATQAVAATEAEQRAALAEAEAGRLRAEMETLAAPSPRRTWWGRRRKA